jgi:hypothetical protein
MNVTLTPHPDSPGPAVQALTAVVTRTKTGVAVRYELLGDLGALVIPELLAPAQADELWKHTCFELFIRRADETGYVEFNMAPTGHWAAYSFERQRSGMKNIAEVGGIPIGTLTTDDAFILRTEIDLSSVKDLPGGEWTVAVTTVVEAADGKRSYWALAHPQGKADFHHPDGFVLKLPAPETT